MQYASDSHAGTIMVVDATLRDGEQAPGVAFSLAEKLTLANLLQKAGVDEVETGIPTAGKDERLLNTELSNLGHRILTFCRARHEDLEAAAECRTRRVHVSFPVSDRMLGLFGLDRRWLMTSLERLGEFCAGNFDFFSVGMLDASRAGIEQCLEFAEAAQSAGFMRIRYADTLGVLFPWEVTEGIRRLSLIGLPVEFHGHNDLGLATANALAAVSGGATAISGTVLGIGERAGNLALEEFGPVLVFSGLGTTGLNLVRLTDLCEQTARISGRIIPPDKPIVGAAVFMHESGIHTAGMLKDQHSFQAFSPVLVGRKSPEMVFGATSGRHALSSAMRAAGKQLEDDEVAGFLDWIRRRARIEKRSFSITDLEQLYGKFQRQG